MLKPVQYFQDLLYMLFSALLNVPSLEPNQFAVRHHFPSFGTNKKAEIRFVAKYAKLQNDTSTILPSTYFDQDPKLKSLYIWLTGYCEREGLVANSCYLHGVHLSIEFNAFSF